MGIKKSQKPKKVNPFELKFNKSKHDVMGKKKGAQVGAPTVSKKRAYEQREKTLGIEYDRKNKISKIVDKRIGEKDSSKTQEEKTAMRFAEERTKNFKRAAKFNLVDEDEEEVLTHGGKALSDIEKYDKSMVSDSEDDEDQIGSRMVKIAHFGGGEKTEEEKIKEKISREDMISNLIAKTKLARSEKQSQKDEMEIMTESLDAKFSNLMQRLSSGFRPTGREKLEKDDFDKLAFTLKTESDPRATPANRKLTEDEKAQQDRETLDQLEAARINSKKNISAHLSADADVDIDAGLKAEQRRARAKNARFEVRFNEDGEMHDEDKVTHSKKILRKDSDEESESGEEEEGEDEEEEEDMDDLLEEDEDELESDEEEEEEEKSKKKPKKGGKTTKSDVPFVFEMPKNYKKFCALLEEYSENMEEVLERLVKCHHPSLKEGNKTKLNKMFLLCLRLYDDMSREDLNEQVVKEMNLAQKTMFDLLKFDIQYGVRCVRALIRQHWKNRQDKEKSSPASFSVISLLRLVAGLFPVSDSWHPVGTPAFFLATNVISNAKLGNLCALAKQVVLATTIIEYVSENRRYVPELVSFTRSALLLAVEEKPDAFSSSGFPISKPHSEMLVVRKNSKNVKLEPISLSEIFDDNSIEDEKLQLPVLRSIISLTQHLRVLYSNQNETYNIVFRPFLNILEKIDTSNLPTELVDEIEELKCSIRAECDSKRKLTQLSLKKTEKSMLKMLEPMFEWDFDPERPHKGKRDEKKKMQKELKNEMRGAIKELRKDTAFLARKQMSSVKSKDRQRVNATKRLMGGLMQQQGEWNKEMRTKDVETKKAKK